MIAPALPAAPDSRGRLFRKLRSRLPEAVERPDLSAETFVRYDDPLAHFEETLAAVGGVAVRVADAAAADAHLRTSPVWAGASQTVSLVPGVGATAGVPDRVPDVHELAGVDVAVVGGRFGVAENAAVWLDFAGLANPECRGLVVLAQHLVVVLPAAEIEHTLHDAYARLTREGAFAPAAAGGPGGGEHRGGPGFGMFVSGPSKTADIEQSLVIGAHGARSLTAYLIGS